MTKPNALPSGLWETLLPQALKLIDEVEIHGGVSNPFFTFGGGTVLMLRHNHRMSKDIDFFVPNPQYLGYVTPRLSEVAEELCGGHYKEASNYVKLQLEAGEIDVVASPNLLPDESAFETWELFGRPVRVETAAEIVAKKMYHRGNEGTPRDLFDLAMVIEHEPAALKPADPFMYRHLDVFSEALAAPPQAMRERFESIDTLQYNPTFEHAIGVTLGYLNNLKAIRLRSAEEASAYIGANDITPALVDTNKGEYCGPILHRTDRHVVQGIGRGEAVIHDLTAFGPTASQQPHVGGDLIRIRYRDGGASASVAQQQTAARGSR